MRWHPERFLGKALTPGLKRLKDPKKIRAKAGQRLRQLEAEVKEQKTELRRVKREAEAKIKALAKEAKKDKAALQKEKGKTHKEKVKAKRKLKQVKRMKASVEKAKAKIKAYGERIMKIDKGLKKKAEVWDRFIKLEDLPRRMKHEKSDEHLMRIVEQIKGEGVYTVDEAYARIAAKTGHDARAVYSAFFGYRPRKAGPIAA